MNCCFEEMEDDEEMAKKEYEYDNTYLVEEFINYPLYGQACDDYPWIDDIITGVANLDLGGNTRPISRNLLYVLISTQPVIKTSLVEEATGKSNSYAKKLTALLRVACRTLEKELRKQEKINKAHCKTIWKE